jgi:hypothetical protein
LVQNAALATAPPAVVNSTIDAAMRFAAGPLAAGAVSVPVAQLADGVLKAMLLKKLKAALPIVLAAALVGTGVTGLAFSQSTGEERKPKPGRDALPAKLVNEPIVGDVEARLRKAESDLQKLTAEVARLRIEVEAQKKSSASPVKDPKAAPDAGANMAIRVYSVKDLVGATGEKESSSLLRVITNTVAPTTWSTVGGTGSIEYFGGSQSLVVNQTAAVHEQVASLLIELLEAKGRGATDKK